MKKKIITVMSVCALMSITGCNTQKMEIKNDKFIIEYGKSISTDSSIYLNNDAEFCKNVTISGLPENEKDKDFPAVGEYELEVLHGKETANIKVSVKDTVSPVFKNIKESYTVEYGKPFEQKIEADDLSSVKITIDDSKVDYKKAGNYKASVKATDEAGNKVEKEITITVKEEKKKETSSTVSKVEVTKNPSDQNTQTSNTNKTNTETVKKPENQSSSDNKTQTTIQKPVTHKHRGPAVENMYFDTCDELDEWALNYQINVLGHGGAYGVSDCSCGKFYINMFY